MTFDMDSLDDATFFASMGLKPALGDDVKVGDGVGVITDEGERATYIVEQLVAESDDARSFVCVDIDQKLMLMTVGKDRPVYRATAQEAADETLVSMLMLALTGELGLGE